MKKKNVIIYGSTGSIGSITSKIIAKNINHFHVVALSTNKNTSKLFKQAKLLNTKNVIITNFYKFKKFKKIFEKRKINVFNDFNKFHLSIKNKKFDYVMSAISGLPGLEPTLKIIKNTKVIAIANKESIICGWNLIYKELKKNKTKFLPVDSEHFSIFSLLNDNLDVNIETIYITASGGPFLHKSKKYLLNVKAKEAVKHPNWSMGKKISIDSATLMNKVFEIIEAQRIFNFNLNTFKILIHPNSYVHAIVKLNNGLLKFVAHDTDMDIPIFNTLFYNDKRKKYFKPYKLDFKKINNLKLSEPNLKKFTSLNFLSKIKNHTTLFETILVAANDELVNYYLQNKIKFSDIVPFVTKIINNKKFSKILNKKPKNIDQIYKLIEEVRLQTRIQCIK
mgnify:CR=1 FL=1